MLLQLEVFLVCTRLPPPPPPHKSKVSLKLSYFQKGLLFPATLRLLQIHIGHFSDQIWVLLHLTFCYTT